MPTCYEHVISLADSGSFATLAGDLNPLHVQPIVARRLLFGGTVVHGVHILLQALQESIGSRGPTSIASIKANFAKPVPSGQPFTVQVQAAEASADLVRILIESNGHIVQRVAVRLVPRAGQQLALAEPSTDVPRCEAPSLKDMAEAAGTVALALDHGLARKLFPTLMHTLPDWQVAALLATTKIVGMRVPGLNSIFTDLDLQFDVDGTDAPATPWVSYRILCFDSRYGVLTLEMTGPALRGQLKALYRPAPVTQAPMQVVMGAVTPNEFAGQRALVLGGSRGLGEVTAKILAAGGGEVWLTYARGRDDALRVAEEIALNRGRAQVSAFDILDLPQCLDGERHGEWQPTHVYIFATPSIQFGPKREWDPRLFGQYSDFYVHGFARTIERIVDLFGLDKQPLNVFYPSTTYIDDPPAGAAEYVAAKSAAEGLSRALARAHPGWRFVTPRLPRLLTDQTNFGKAKAADPLSCLLPLIRELHALA